MADEPLTDPVEAPETPPEIANLQRERDDYYDRLLRKSAEFDNYRRRIERERREQAEQSIVDLLLELLLVVDDFDLALTVGNVTGAAVREAGDLRGLLARQVSSPVEWVRVVEFMVAAGVDAFIECSAWRTKQTSITRATSGSARICSIFLASSSCRDLADAGAARRANASRNTRRSANFRDSIWVDSSTLRWSASR